MSTSIHFAHNHHESGARARTLRLGTFDQAILRWFGYLTGLLCVGYFFFDRGFAHVHIPHAKLYLGEVVLLVGFFAIASGTGWLMRAVRLDSVVGILILFMAYCALRTFPQFASFGVTTTVRDASLWYYGFFTIFVLAALLATGGLIDRLLDGFNKVVPCLTLWLPIALLLERSNFHSPKFRFSNVPLLSHKPGNICVAAAICLLWLWLVPAVRRSGWIRSGLVWINLFTILMGLTQTRGGGIAALVGVGGGVVFLGKRRLRVLMTAFVTAVIVLLVATTFNLSYHTKHRTISSSQLIQNLSSISGGQSTNQQLAGTVAFRTSLWSGILSKEVSTSHLVAGFGFGPDLASIGGLAPKPHQVNILELRSAHNSLLDILARTGIVGSALFIWMFASWWVRLIRSRRKAGLAKDEVAGGVISVCLLGNLAILINSFFDPTLESPQVDIIFFVLFAVGIFLSRRILNKESIAAEPVQHSGETPIRLRPIQPL
jgi:hypothetical protein